MSGEDGGYAIDMSGEGSGGGDERGGLLSQLPSVGSLQDSELRQLLRQMIGSERSHSEGDSESDGENTDSEFNGSDLDDTEEFAVAEEEDEHVREGRDRIGRMEAQAQALEGSVLELVGDIHSVRQWLSKAVPLTLLKSVFLYYHGKGLLICVWHSAVMLRCSSLLVSECRKLTSERDRLSLLSALFLSVLHSIIVISSLLALDALSSFVLRPPTHIGTFWDVLWLVVLNDLLMRYVSIAAKSTVILLDMGLSKRKEALLLSAMEMTALYYRVCLPAPVWLQFYLHQVGHMSQPMIATIIAVYAIFKFASALRAGHRMLSSITAFFKGTLPFGSLPSQEELLEAGGECSICRDEMGSPIKLSCGHIFCEDCVTEWFHRKTSCPLCRATVQTSSGGRSYGDGSTSMVLHIL